jgi:hypothetical protein
MDSPGRSACPSYRTVSIHARKNVALAGNDRTVGGQQLGLAIHEARLEPVRPDGVYGASGGRIYDYKLTA